MKTMPVVAFPVNPFLQKLAENDSDIILDWPIMILDIILWRHVWEGCVCVCVCVFV